MMLKVIRLSGAAALLLPAVASAQTAAPEQLPTIEVVGVSPVAGSDIDRDKIPSSTTTLSADQFDKERTPDLIGAMVRALPGVSLSDQSGNPFQINLDYRGFTASPVPGTVQGLAVYQNGTRINEAYGDVVNWDFIPEVAINRMTLQSNNPVFGLNALGGALSIDMKNGFNYQGVDFQAIGGAYGRAGASAQAGGQKDGLSTYVAIDATNDNGWKDFSSSSQLRRIYADVGTRKDTTEFHVSFTGADDFLGAVAATPVELLNQRWSSVYTWPQTTHLQLAFLQANGSWKPSDSFAVNANAYYRGFWQSHVDGNGTDAVPCGNLLCIPDIDGNLQNLNVFAPVGVPNNISPSAFLGEIDRTWTTTNSFGGSLQGTSTYQVLGHDNHLVVGVSVDHGRTQFTGNSELGTVDQNLFVTGTGVFIDQPAADISPVSLLATNTYTGVYATDTFDVTSQLALTAGARFNIAQIGLQDEMDGLNANPLLTANERYQHLNPVVGGTYKITPGLTAYAGFSEANRAPTPLELGCSSPTNPCMIDNFLIADPPLKQVVAQTYEAGLRGQYSSPDFGQLSWSLGAYRALSQDDIISIASSAILGFGYFQNAGDTLRQGIEAKANYNWNRWTAYANFTYVDATYKSPLTLSAPSNPAADENGLIYVTPGNHIPGIPNYRFKIGAEYNLTDAWKLGADLNAIGSQYLIGDNSNQNPKLPAYWVVNLHSSYQVTKNIEVFGLVQNLFNQQYYSSGTFFETGGFTSNSGGDNLLGNLSDPRTLLPGMPFAAYAGLRVKFDPNDPAALVDMPVKAPVKALVKAPPAVPTYSWTGFYIGGNAGGAFAIGSYNDTLTGESLGRGKSDSFIGGGQVGFNYQAGIVVAGVEAMFDGLSQTSGVWPGTIGGDTFAAQARVNSMTTVAGRLGISSAPTDHWLWYAKGGVGWAGTSVGLNDLTQGTTATTTATRNGWLGGLGVEYAFAPNWTMRIEYDYLGLENYAAASPFAPGDTFNVSSNNIQTITVGFNYLFNIGPAVTARF